LYQVNATNVNTNYAPKLYSTQLLNSSSKKGIRRQEYEAQGILILVIQGSQGLSFDVVKMRSVGPQSVFEFGDYDSNYS
jgi:hypothetical protein